MLLSNQSRIVCCLLFVVALFASSQAVAQQVEIDFESSMIGDSLGTLGFTGDYAAETISAVGVSGSKGVQIATHSNGFPSGFLRDLDFGGEITSATFSIDAQVESMGSVGDRSPLFYLSMGSETAQDNVSITFVRYPGQFAHFLFSSIPNSDPFEESAQNSESELGFAGGGTSSYFNLTMEVEKISANNYDFTGSVRDVGGSVLQSVQIQSADFSDILNNGPIYLGFGLNSNSDQAADNVRFDNFSFSATTVPEPGADLVLFAGILITGLVRQRTKA